MQVRGVYINENAWASSYGVALYEVREHATELFQHVLEDFVSERCLNSDPGPGPGMPDHYLKGSY